MIFDKKETRKKLCWWSDLSVRGSSVWCLLLLQVVDEVAAGAVRTEPGAVVGLAQIRLVLEKRSDMQNQICTEYLFGLFEHSVH